MKSERVLATVLFTDIVGSTERAAELGDRAWRELLARHHALVRRELRRFGGRELTVSGDGFLATFERPEPAIRCACAVRDGVRELGLEIRSGLHAGEVEVGEGTVGGIAVHTGARVAALAGPGEVLVSAALRDFVAGSGFTFEERGVHTLKGVPGEWRLFAVTDQPLRLPMGEVGERVREARLAPVVLGYLAVAMIVLWLTGYLQGRFGLPGWTLGAAVVLLAIGLLSVTATAWVQARTRRAAAGGVSTPVEQSLPGAWQIAPRELGRSLARGRLPHLTWGRSLLGGAVAFSLLFGLAGLYVIVRDRGRTFAPAEAVAEAAGPGIAVLPFTVRGDGLDVWREGMVDVISTNLDGAAGMRSIDSRTVLARWDEVAEGSGRADLATSLEAARRAEARYAVVGSAIATGPDVRLAAEIYDVASRRRLGQGQAVGAPDSILPLVNQLSIEVLRALLQGTDADVPWLEVATLTTSSVAALKPYLEGEALYRRSDFAGAVAAYQRALEADSTFALALYRLGDAYGWLETAASELAHDFTTRAAREADRLPEREALLLRGLLALDRGQLAAIEILQGAVRRYPDDAEAWFLLGDSYYHLGAAALVDRWEEGRRALSNAVRLDPSFAPYYEHLMDAAAARGDAAKFAKLVDAHGRLAPDTPRHASYRVLGRLAFGDAASREAALAALDTMQLSPSDLSTILTGLQSRFEFASVSVAAGKVLKRRPEYATIRLAGAVVARGDLRTVNDELEDSAVRLESRAALAYQLQYLGLPLPAASAEALLAALPDTAMGFQVFYAGAYAADRGDWTRHAKAVSRLRGAAQRALEGADTTASRVREGAARALEGYGLRKKGQPEALRALQSAQREVVGHSGETEANATIRWWVADLLVELDRAAEAVPWYLSLVRANRPDPFAARRVGAAYERIGQPAKARAAYETFLMAWRDADPELQPLVDETRAAVRRVGRT